MSYGSEKICLYIAKLTRIEAVGHRHVDPVIFLGEKAISFGVSLDVGIEILANEQTVLSLLNIVQQRKQIWVSDLPKLSFFDGQQNPQQVATRRFPISKACVYAVLLVFIGAKHADTGRTNGFAD